MNKFKNFKRFTNNDIYFCDIIEVKFNYLENGEKLASLIENIKLKKPMYLRYPRDEGEPFGNYCYILDQFDDKKLGKGCIKLLENCRNKSTLVEGNNFAAYLGKNITSVEANYYGKMIKLETNYENYCKLKEFENETRRKN